MSRPGPAIVARLTADQLATIAGAADFGCCLECGEPVPFALAIDGQALCTPCDELAAEVEASHAERFAELGARIVAESERWGHWSEAREVELQLAELDQLAAARVGEQWQLAL